MNVVTIGGGGGHAQVLRGLKQLNDLTITAICPSTDSGGSTGILQRDYQTMGYLGDLTKCIAALCPDERVANALLHRFSNGFLAGHSVKNILLLALEQANDPEVALEVMYRLCGLGSHRVIPVTRAKTTLCARLQTGNHIEGEMEIDTLAKNPLWSPDLHPIQEIYLKPSIPASEAALMAVHQADWCVICPGDLYSSILPVLLPEGMKSALSRHGLPIVIVLNIMTKKGETDQYSAGDFVDRIEQYIGLPASVVLVNNSQLSDELVLRYAVEHKVQLVAPSVDTSKQFQFASLATLTPQGAVYHDPDLLAQALDDILHFRYLNGS